MKQDTIWQFYTTSREAWDAMLSAILEAKQTIDLEQYIFYNDDIGSRFIELLKLKAKEGVRVRILCDAVGSFPIYRSPLQSELQDANITLRFFNSIVPWSPHKESFWYFRDHRKLLIIDGKIGFTGGACIAEEMKEWRESHLRIEGLIVEDMTASFEIMWEKLYKKPRFYLKKRKELIGAFHYLTNSPLPQKRFIYYELIKAIRDAKYYINLTTPYFLPDHRLVRAIKFAIRRGVKVKLLVPMYPNHYVVRYGAGSYFDEMLSVGVRIFRYKNMIHGKTMVIDGIWSSIGSLNLDNISLRYNFEANIVSRDKNFAFELERQFIEDLKLSEELLLPHWRKRSIIQKFLELLVWPIRKLL
jgi:cardiolipin synthase A/B